MNEPILKTILMADFAFRGENAKIGLIGIFTNQYATSFPTRVRSGFIYLEIDDAPKVGKVIINLMNDQQSVLWSSGENGYNYEKQEKESVRIDNFFPFEPPMIFKAGFYRLVVTLNGSFLGDRLMGVLELPKELKKEE